MTVNKVNDFLSDEQGATAVEYGMFVALIAAVIVTLVSTLGGKIKDLQGKLVLATADGDTVTVGRVTRTTDYAVTPRS